MTSKSDANVTGHFLFVARSYAQFSYYDSILAQLLDAGHQVTYLYDKAWSRHWGNDDALRRFCQKYPQLQVGEAKRRKKSWKRTLLFACRELRTYAHYLNRREQSSFYARRWQPYLPVWAQAVCQKVPARLANFLLGNLLWKALVRLPELCIGADSGIKRDIKDRQATHVLASPGNLRFSEEIEYIKAANALKIPTTIPVYSWDNLSTKGLYAVLPTQLWAWNHVHQQEAMAYHGMPKAGIRLTGARFFDKWKHVSPNTSLHEFLPHEFLERLGLDPARPVLLYLGSSQNIAVDETPLVMALWQAIQADEHLKNVQLILRPHSANRKPFDALEASGQWPVGCVLWPKAGGFPDTPQSQDEFWLSCQSSFATVGLNTSAMIDAVILDRPSFALLCDDFSKTQTEATHFRHLTACGAVVTCNLPQLLMALQQLQLGQDNAQAQRRYFVETYIWPNA